jgi:hypothetical protein
MSNNGGGLIYLEHKKIDYKKWDNCIVNAGNSRVYAMSWHLDRTAEIWDALVLGNYDFVMPLPVRKKWGIKYIYQPLFSQQLGIFPAPSEEIASLFYTKVASLFRYSDVQINSQNLVLSMKDIEFVLRENYLLELTKKYKNISSGYSNNASRNIAKSRKNNLHYVSGLRIEDYLEFKESNSQPQLNKYDFIRLKSLIAIGQYKGIGEISGVYSSDNRLCAAVYFCRWKDRLIYMNAATSSMGKEVGGMYFLLDQFIRQSAGTGMVLDLEGSMIPGVARFYSGFGARPESYHQLRINRLPQLVKWLKRR